MEVHLLRISKAVNPWHLKLKHVIKHTHHNDSNPLMVFIFPLSPSEGSFMN